MAIKIQKPLPKDIILDRNGIEPLPETKCKTSIGGRWAKDPPPKIYAKGRAMTQQADEENPIRIVKSSQT